MGRIVTVAHVPGHLDRKGPEVDRGRHELDITVGRDRQQPLGFGRIEVLLAKHRIVELRQRFGMRAWTSDSPKGVTV